MPTALIVLAAGQGTRMNSDLPQVLHPLGGAPMFVHALKAGGALNPDRKILVVGHGAQAVTQTAKSFDPDIEVVEQAEQRGTGHAVAICADVLAGFKGDVAVLFADTPFVGAETLQRMAEARKNFDIVGLGFEAADPMRYGRLIMDGKRLNRIVEFKDADDEERRITFCNSGLLLASSEVLFSLVSGLQDDNAAGELYLTDIITLANENGLSATAIQCPESETLGINTRSDLAAAEAGFQKQARNAALENGVTLTAPETVFFSHDTAIGRDAFIEPNVVFGAGVTVETGARIRAFSHLEDCHVGSGAVVGPFARIRPGTELANDTHVGNFVEIKNSHIGTGSKVNHLSYIGDTDMGEGTNVGAGSITCNYDGVSKHRTTIGDSVFIGSNTMLVAPVSVGDQAMTATGTVVTANVGKGDLAISRGRQINKSGLAVKLFEKLKNSAEKRRKGQ